MTPKEKHALGRTLLVAREVFSATGKNEPELNPVALLDSVSAALSHVNDEKRPLSKCIGALKSEIKAKNRTFYVRVKTHFSLLMPVIDFDTDKALKHIPAMIYGSDKVCEKLVKGETDRARSMADALKSYPGFLFGEFDALSDEQFYELVFGYYPKLYDEPFMDDMRGLFEDKPPSETAEKYNTTKERGTTI